jgi:hypothetical protein
MSGSPFREQRLRIGEARRVLRRALELSDPPGEDSATISKTELETMATNLGVTPAALERSFDTGDEPAVEVESGLWGAPKELSYETIIDRELTAARHEEVADVIREVMGETGRVEVLGSSLTWTPALQYNGQQRALSVSLRARNGKTVVRIRENFTQLRLGAWLGLGIGLGLGGGTGMAAVAGARGGGIPAAIAFLLVTVVSLVLARVVCASVAKSRAAQLGQLQQRIFEALGASPGPRIEARGDRADVDTDAEAHAEAEAEAEAEAGRLASRE